MVALIRSMLRRRPATRAARALLIPLSALVALLLAGRVSSDGVLHVIPAAGTVVLVALLLSQIFLPHLIARRAHHPTPTRTPGPWT